MGTASKPQEIEFEIQYYKDWLKIWIKVHTYHLRMDALREIETFRKNNPDDFFRLLTVTKYLDDEQEIHHDKD